MNTHSERRGKTHKRRPGKKSKIPFTMVEKEVHGKAVWVKVYAPAYATGDRAEAERLGLTKKPVVW